MNEPGRSPQDQALQRAIRQLPVSDGPPTALDERIRARAHHAVQRRRGLPLWLSAAASVFVVFFAASLWRYQGESALPSGSDESSISAEQFREGADALEEVMTSQPRTPPAAAAPIQFEKPESSGRSEQAAIGSAAASRLSVQADDAAAPAQLIAPTAQRAQSAVQGGSASNVEAAARERVSQAAKTAPPQAFPEPAPEPEPVPPPAPMAPPPAPPAPTMPAEPGGPPAPIADAAKSVAPARSLSTPTMADRVDAVEAQRKESDPSLTTSGRAVGTGSRRESMPRESEARDARTRLDQDAVELSESFPASCQAGTAVECFDQVRRWRDDGRQVDAVALLRDTLARFDEPAPEDLRALLE